MERPDLTMLAATAQDIRERIDRLCESLDEAYDLALGEADPETDEEIRPGNGDNEELLEKAKGYAAEAQFTLAKAIDTLAMQQGYREFEEAETVIIG